MNNMVSLPASPSEVKINTVYTSDEGKVLYWGTTDFMLWISQFEDRSVEITG